MEERLFLIGLAMAAYAWLSRKFKENGTLNSGSKAGAWHAAFCALAGFSICLVLVMSLDTGGSANEIYPSLAVGALCGLVGFWRARLAYRKADIRQYYLGEDLEWADTVFSAALLASVLMYFVVQAFKIPSSSMESTLLIGDHLFVNKFIYGLRIPMTGKRVLPLKPVARGDIIVFQFPDDDRHSLHCGSVQYKKDFIKRVVGLPGDMIRVEKGKVFVNGAPLAPEPYAQYLDGPMRLAAPQPGIEPSRYQELWQGHALDRELDRWGGGREPSGPRDHFGPVVIPHDAYFVMGDNRDRSCDSRFWGPVESRLVKGKAWFLYWPPARMRIVR